jgi:hypothetical protein
MLLGLPVKSKPVLRRAFRGLLRAQAYRLARGWHRHFATHTCSRAAIGGRKAGHEELPTPA